MATAIATTTFPKITDPRLNGQLGSLEKNLIASLNKISEDDGNAVFKVKDTRTRVWDLTAMKELPAGSVFPEGQQPPTATLDMDHQVARRTSTYGLGTEATQDALRDARAGKINLEGMLAEKLSQSRIRTILGLQQTWYFESLKGVTLTTIDGRQVIDPNSYDGVSYFHDEHGFVGVQSVKNSNISEARRTLTKTSLVSMMQQASGWFDSQGSPMQNEAVGVVVGDHLLGYANVLLKSDKDPDNANNAENILKYENYGKALTGVRHYRYMGVDDFMLHLALPGGAEMDGTCIYFLEGQRFTTKQYWKNNAEDSRVFEWRSNMQVCGDNPYEWITNRQAA